MLKKTQLKLQKGHKLGRCRASGSEVQAEPHIYRDVQDLALATPAQQAFLEQQSVHPDMPCRHCASVTHPLLAMLLDSQSKPSYRPSPDVAHVLWIYLHNMETSP